MEKIELLNEKGNAIPKQREQIKAQVVEKFLSDFVQRGATKATDGSLALKIAEEAQGGEIFATIKVTVTTNDPFREKAKKAKTEKVESMENTDQAIELLFSGFEEVQ